MEMDDVLEQMEKWYEPLCQEETFAFQYLHALVKKIFRQTQAGIPLQDVIDFLEKRGVAEETAKAIGFPSMGHFLFHLDDILEVRGLEINQRTQYFLFLKEHCRNFSDDDKFQKKKLEMIGAVYRDSTFETSFGKVISLHRGFIPVLGSSEKVKHVPAKPEKPPTSRTSQGTDRPRAKNAQKKLQTWRKETFGQRNKKNTKIQNAPKPDKKENANNFTRNGQVESTKFTTKVQKIKRTVVFETNPVLRQDQHRVPGIGHFPRERKKDCPPKKHPEESKYPGSNHHEKLYMVTSPQHN